MKKVLSVACIAVLLMLGGCGSKQKSANDSLATIDSSIATSVTDSEQDSANGSEQSSSTESSKGEAQILDKIVKNDKPTIIDFNAVWCGPCRQMKPIFDKLASEFGNKFNFVSIDIDKNPEIAEKYKVQAIPTFIFLDEDGEEVNRFTGALPESDLRNELVSPSW